jgi:hypothetical protein
MVLLFQLFLQLIMVGFMFHEFMLTFDGLKVNHSLAYILACKFISIYLRTFKKA